MSRAAERATKNSTSRSVTSIRSTAGHFQPATMSSPSCKTARWASIVIRRQP